jgi:alpha-ketoglutarate-dependent taurine dioxygenase
LESPLKIKRSGGGSNSELTASPHIKVVMEKTKSTPPSSGKMGAVKRKTVSVSAERLIVMEPLRPGVPLPLVFSPDYPGVDITEWAQRNRESIDAWLFKHGAILFRDWRMNSVDEFERLATAVAGGDLMDYSYRSTPRSAVSGKIFTSTEYPADQSIPLHNEMAYSRAWPMKIWFHCVKAAEVGGETPIADSRNVFARIDPRVRERFMRKKVLYVRNYGGGLDLSWQNVFQTTSRSEVESFCLGAGIEFEWGSGDRLRTRQVCQAVARHPRTGEMVWFNQAHLFHVSNLTPEMRDRFLAEFKGEELARNAYYGDGSPIEPSDLEEIRQAYLQETIIFPWREGDILMLDNMLTAHGRKPFTGSRKVVVAMAGAFSSQDFQLEAPDTSEVMEEGQ